MATISSAYHLFFASAKVRPNHCPPIPMAQPSKLFLMLAVTVLYGFSSGDCLAAEKYTEANVAKGKAVYIRGKGTACVTCHGDRGQGNAEMGVPLLSNTGFDYIVKQLSDFSLDRRKSPGVGAVMNRYAKALSDQDRFDVSAYLNSMMPYAAPVIPAPELSGPNAPKSQDETVDDASEGGASFVKPQGSFLK